MGQHTTASGDGAVALGSATTASGLCSFAMGVKSASTGTDVYTVASGNQSVAMGIGVNAGGNSSQAFGQRTKTTAPMSSAFGNYTIASGRACVVAGQYNVEDTNPVDTTHGGSARKYVAIIGNGTAENARSNALTVDWDGNVVAAGKITVGTAPSANSDVATKQYVDENSGKVTEVTNSSTGAVSLALDAGKIYHFTGALTALTITLNAPASGQLAHYRFDFNSGSTAPTVTIPNTVTMPSGFTVEASKYYEIDILNGYGAVMAW
ncbi:MAG: hypothetical protein J6Y20_08980 [Lachnospiraceae bacterium]|nr:hypothetical protein [Lachnospiraceae bacterium]